MDALQAMRLFVLVTQAGSFSAAGRKVRLSPASVSRHMNALEANLGARLLNRSSRQLTLTEAGHAYLRSTEHILAEINEANEFVSQLQSVPRGTLHVHARASIAEKHIAPALPVFLATYPELRVRFWISDHPIDLAEQNIDVAIRVGAMPDSSLRARKLASGRMVVCASETYLRGHAAPNSPRDLVHHNCLTYLIDMAPSVWRFRNQAASDEIRVTGNLETNNAEILRLAVLQGMGIALLPEWLVGGDLHGDALCQLLPGYQATITTFDTGIYAVYHERRYMAAKVRLFLDFLLRVFADREDWTLSPSTAPELLVSPDPKKAEQKTLKSPR